VKHLNSLPKDWTRIPFFCQEDLDATVKEEQLEHDEKVALERIESPLTSPDSYCFLSLEEHIEKFWGVDYNSDQMPSYSD
jgi:hypothetical protein